MFARQNTSAGGIRAPSDPASPGRTARMSISARSGSPTPDSTVRRPSSTAAARPGTSSRAAIRARNDIGMHGCRLVIITEDGDRGCVVTPVFQQRVPRARRARASVGPDTSGRCSSKIAPAVAGASRPARRRKPKSAQTPRPQGGSGSDPGRVPGARAARLAGANPTLPRRHPGELRAPWRHSALGARSAPPAPSALHRGRDARRLRAVDPRRTAVVARPGGGAGLRPRRDALPTQRLLGCDLEDQSPGAAVSRSGVPQPAGARDELLPRVRQPARREDAAQLLARLRFALGGPEAVGDERRELLGGGRDARRDPPLSPDREAAGARPAHARSDGAPRPAAPRSPAARDRARALGGAAGQGARAATRAGDQRGRSPARVIRSITRRNPW